MERLLEKDVTGNRDGWWLVAVVSPLLLLSAWMLWPDTREPAQVWPSSSESGNGPDRTIASQWEDPSEPVQPEEAVESANGTDPQPEGSTPREIDLDRLQHALANIGIDEDGNLILDEVALASLRQAFRGLEGAGPEAIGELQLYVEAGLAGETGAQASQILGDYARYRNALTEAEAQWADEDGLTPRQKLKRTIELRREHMDPLTASQLFAGEDAHQRYLITMEEIRSDPELSEEQRRQAMDRARDDLHSGALLLDQQDSKVAEDLRSKRQNWKELGLSDRTRSYLERQTLGLVAARDLAGSSRDEWQNRYQQFEQERDSVLKAGLAEDEKQRQVEALVDTYFTPEEVEAARHWLPRHLREDMAE